MAIEVRGIRENGLLFRAIEDFLTSRKPMEKIVKAIADTIDDRTSKGKDYLNRKFEPYSEAYKKRKGSSQVDLRLSGKMLDAMKTKVISAKEGKVYIEARSYGGKTKAKTDMIAQIHTTGTGKQPRREFMNISKSMERKIIKEHYDDPLLVFARRFR